MSRVYMGTQGWGVFLDATGAVQAGQSVTIKNLDGTNATHYSARTGGSSSTSSITTDATGTLARWIDAGFYTLTVGANTYDVQAVPGDIAVVASDAGKGIGILAGISTSRSATDNAATIQAHLDTGKHVFIPGNDTGTAYDVGALTFPVASHGGATMFGEGPTRTKLHYTGSSHFITFGDGGATDTRFQAVIGMELTGNTNALSAVRFNTTRWCSVKQCDVREFTNASAHAVIIEGSTAARANYFNVLEDVQFTNNTSHVKLHGNADGTGANSNYLHRCHFSLATGAQAVLIDGGDTNRIYKCEFADATAIGVKTMNAALKNVIEQCMFDDPVKAWDIGSGSVDTELLWNKQSVDAITSSTDAGTNTIRRDSVTETARVSVYHASNQSITNNTITTITFNNEDYDPQNMKAAGATSDLTAPVAGIYHVELLVTFAANATGVRMARVCKNGDTPIVAEDQKDPPADGTSTCSLNVSRDIALAAGDFVRARVYQTSGGALNLNAGNSNIAQFQLRRVG